MSPRAIPYFATALFLALVFLLRWKHRRDASARLNRGLDSYLSGEQNRGAAPRRDLLKRLDRKRH